MIKSSHKKAEIKGNMMENGKQEITQYALWQILLIWALGGMPMWVFGWILYPRLSEGLPPIEAGFVRIQVITCGLIWQFVLALIILYREEGSISIKTLSRRFWLQHPVSPKTGETNKKLWWWLIPAILIYAAFAMTAGGVLSEIWLDWFPSLAAPEGFDPSILFSPENLPQMVGLWPMFWWFLAMGVFNTFLGEEFLYRGVLLPKMEGVFGKWDWVANGVLFTLYHIHQPWTWLSILPTDLSLAFTGKYFKSTWFPIILHTGQTIFFVFIILGVVLGLA